MKNDKDPFDVLPSCETKSSGKSSFDQKEEEILFLTRMLRDMPDRQPPQDLAKAILRSLQPKQISIWRRLYLWAITPRSVNISPIKLIPATAVAIALALSLTIYFLPRDKSPLDVNQGKQKLVSVTFTLRYPQARSVSLIGSFNQWKPQGFALHSKGREKVWVLELQLPEGRHKYAFLVDGKIVVPDPNAQFSESDGFGNKNSILFTTKDETREI
jgi:hypothetical protein